MSSNSFQKATENGVSNPTDNSTKFEEKRFSNNSSESRNNSKEMIKNDSSEEEKKFSHKLNEFGLNPCKLIFVKKYKFILNF